MSCTVVSLPVLLFSAIAGTTGSIIQFAQAVKGGLTNTNEGSMHISDEAIENLSKQEFKTVIMDKRTLLKTITEHGAENIQVDGNDITCDCEGFHIQFISHHNAPYSMKVAFNNPAGLDNLVSDIGTEYSVNAQEVSYNKIKERLGTKNLQINDEEILEDDTIVLTVNLD